MRVKSFSMDNPETPRPTSLLDQGLRTKSSSFSSAPGSFTENLYKHGSSSKMSSSRGSSGSEIDRRSPKPASFQNSPTGVGGLPRAHKKKLTLRMKSFSVDTTDPPTPLTSIDESSKRKSNSFTSAASCFGGSSSPPSPTNSGSAFTRRAKFMLKSSSVDIDDAYDSLSPKSNQSLSPRSGSPIPKTQRKGISPSNSYVVLYNFKGKKRGDLDLKAGTTILALDTSDPDWWKGRYNGRFGYFPSSYVARIGTGEKPLQVVTGVEVTAGEQETKLFKDQIVVCEEEGPVEENMVMIRTAEQGRIPCPVRYLAEIPPS